MNFDDLFDRFFNKLFVAMFIICVLLAAGAIYTAIHFIAKYW